MAVPVFLRAEWRKLLMVNYAIDPKHLARYVPANTELDLWNGKCYVSLVGFMFLNTKVKGISFPFFRDFCEINLRFYVKHHTQDGWQRGVVFIKEFVPKRMIAFIANTFYNEHYATVPMKNLWKEERDALTVSYSWKNGQWHSLEAKVNKLPVAIIKGSEEEFITEHYRGYARLAQTESLEYIVEHPRWEVYPVQSHSINVDFGKSYGKGWEFLNHLKPESVFLAEGSEISVSNKLSI